MPSNAPRPRARVRTTPKLMPFIVGAVFLAFTASVITVYSTPQDENYTTAASLGYMTFVFAIPALVLAATAWLVTEKVLRSKAQTYDMERVRRNGRSQGKTYGEGSEAPRAS